MSRKSFAQVEALYRFKMQIAPPKKEKKREPVMHIICVDMTQKQKGPYDACIPAIQVICVLKNSERK